MLLHFVIASVAKRSADANANEEILSALFKRGPDALDVLIEALEAEEDVHKRVIERIRKGVCVNISCSLVHIAFVSQNGQKNLWKKLWLYVGYVFSLSGFVYGDWGATAKFATYTQEESGVTGTVPECCTLNEHSKAIDFSYRIPVA